MVSIRQHKTLAGSCSPWHVALSGKEMRGADYWPTNFLLGVVDVLIDLISFWIADLENASGFLHQVESLSVEPTGLMVKSMLRYLK